MDDRSTQVSSGEEPADVAAQATGYGLSRRDFIAATAILAGSALLMLSRIRLPSDVELPPIPADFKRFILTQQSPTVATEKLIVALGSQCPDLDCVLWWADDHEFQFFESVEQITNLYVQDEGAELIWLD